MAFAPASLRIREFELVMVQAARLETSPYSRAQVAYDFQGGGWEAKLSLAHLSAAQAAEVEAWLASLKGPMVPFEAYLFRKAGPFGTTVVDAEVAVAALARAETLQVQQFHAAGGPSMVLNFKGNGALGFTYGALAVGDRITLGGHLHVVTMAGNSIAGGLQTITVWPRLRADLAPGDSVGIVAPYGKWRLASGRSSWTRAISGERTQTIDLIEAI